MTSLGSPSPFFFGGKKAYAVERSLRFNDDDTAYLSRTQGTPTSDKIGTYSTWFKLGNLDIDRRLRMSFTNGSNYGYLRVHSDNTLQFLVKVGAYTGSELITNQVLRDASAWYHVVLAVDTTQATASDRVKIYLNGTQITSFSTETYFSQHQVNSMFSASGSNQSTIGSAENATVRWDGYIAEVNNIDGQQLTPASFGETDSITGQWIPKKYVGSYGTNGFYLNFSDNSGTTATTLGKDSSGNGNNFTPNNFATSDAVKDSPTNNFATLDVLAESGGTYSEGNLKVVGASDPASSNIGFASGKFYYEAYVDATSNIYVGVIPIDYGLNPARGGGWPHGAIAYRSSGQQYKLKAGGGYSSVSASYGASYTAGDIIGCAVDIDNDTVTFYKNGVSQGNTSDGVSYITASGTTSIYGAIVYCNGGNNTFRVNFGQDSTFQGTVSAGGNTDANGIGDFKYTVPSGYKALCSANLPDPTIKLPNKHFDTLLYTGNNTDDRDITGLNFQPDWLWIKERSGAESHLLFNSVIGTSDFLKTNSNAGEGNDPNALQSFNSDGFQIGTSSELNANSETYVAFNWNAGDTDGVTYRVVVSTAGGSGNKYRFRNSTNNATFNADAVTLDLAEGGTYIFDGSDSTMDSHPIVLAENSNGSPMYETGVTYELDGSAVANAAAYASGYASATTRRLLFTVPSSAPNLYYVCYNHLGMGGAINTNTTLGSSNFDGSTQSTVKANTTAGFSIVKYIGQQNATDTIGHGLGVQPQVVITKSRNSTYTYTQWYVYHHKLSTNYFLFLNQTNAQGDGIGDYYVDSSFSSTVFAVGDDIYGPNVSSNNYIAYCFSEVAGYSKFGSYTGNSSSDGTFVYTGFRPAWVMIKRIDATDHWNITDNKRGNFNVIDEALYANLSMAEDSNSYNRIDYLSNGFKYRANNSQTNQGTHIYLAFAEAPFKNARAR